LLSLTGSAPAVPDTPSGDTYISGGDAGKRTYYTIPAVSGATSYTWDKSGSGYPYNPPYYNWWTGTTSASLYYYGANDGGVAIWVKSNNSCGSSANSSVLNVSIHSY
jgi:hypothetical protein